MLSRINLIIKPSLMKPLTRYVGRTFQRALSGNYTNEDNIIRCKRTLEFPEEDLFSFFEKRLVHFENHPAMVDCVTGSSLTYSELFKKSKQLASFFDKKGYNQGDCVGIHVQNCIEYPITLFGAMAKGMVLTTANPAYTHHEINLQLNSSKAKALFTNSQLLETALKAVDNTNVDIVVSLDETSSNDSGVLHLSDILEQGDENFKTNLTVNPVTDTAFLLYSSGTTGLPKGVMLTHHNFICNTLQVADVLAQEEFCKNVLCVLPLYHIYGLDYIMAAHLLGGCTIHTLPGFDPEMFLKTIENYKIDKVPIVPPIALFMLNHPLVDKFDLSSVKRVTVGAAPIDELVTNAFHKKFPNSMLLQGYGMTESMITHIQTDFMKSENLKPGSAGLSLPNVEWKVHCLETGQALPAYEKGEICTRGTQVMKGYLNNEEATSSCLTEDGWLHSGDLGYYDEYFNIFVVDRLKELIKYKGFQVAPAELEDLLLGHAEIDDSCVIGVPDDRSGELPRAFIVRKKDSNIGEDDIHVYLKDLISDHKRLRGGIQFVDALPKSPSGKLLRRIVKQEYLTAIGA